MLSTSQAISLHAHRTTEAIFLHCSRKSLLDYDTIAIHNTWESKDIKIDTSYYFCETFFHQKHYLVIANIGNKDILETKLRKDLIDWTISTAKVSDIK